MLFGVNDILFSCIPRLFTSETMVTMIEREDTIRLAVVPLEPLETVKE